MPPTNATPSKINGSDQSIRSAELTRDATNDLLFIDGVVQKAQQRIAPVWPLKDYVAVNPYAGFSANTFLSTREYLRTLSDLEFFMPVDYYRQQFAAGSLERSDISAAVDELVADGIEGAERIDVNQVIALLREKSDPSPTADATFTKAPNPNRTLFTIAETIDKHSGSNWCRLIGDEISRHCASHYDEGQAAWRSASQQLPLYTAWRSAQKHDRNFEILGVPGFRKFVNQLPHDGRAAVVLLLRELGLPTSLWEDYLLCTALTLPGWSAWTNYQHREAEIRCAENSDFIGLLAIRLAFEVGVAKHLDFHVAWPTVAIHHQPDTHASSNPTDHELLRYALLKASEIAFRNRLVAKLHDGPDASTSGDALRENSSPREPNALAQMVFCIDVRSERIRRHLESTSGTIETFGFAGFFGVPMEFVELGKHQGTSNVPVLITPQFKVREQIGESDSAENRKAINLRGNLRFLRKAWKEFQSSAASMFAFVETTGLFYGWKLLARSIGVAQPAKSRYDGVASSDQEKLSPNLEGLYEQGIDLAKQSDLAESILRGIGIVDDFARLVVFCGHGSQVENNPLKASLDCGACGGHSGEPNARFAAKLLNQTQVRNELAQRGISIPETTHFVAALHNTTTDTIEIFDNHLIPTSCLEDLEELSKLVDVASLRTKNERALTLPSTGEQDLTQRSVDWSEVRPEWGLAGNAAFIAAPRELTRNVSLDGRSFLHSYDHRNDPNHIVLEQIMTAPLVVANWINMQYYASTVDPIHFGSGNKTVHNVVGSFGVFSGNGGDLMTGLPWQSLHDGTQYQHHPLRLLAVIAAPRDAIESILEKHPNVADLVSNGWIQLLAAEDDAFYRYTAQQTWEDAPVVFPQPINA